MIVYFIRFFEGVCVTTVILAPGACGREVRTCTPTPISGRSSSRIPAGSFLLSKIRFFDNFLGKWSPFLGLSSQAPSWRQDGPRCNLDRPGVPVGGLFGACFGVKVGQMRPKMANLAPFSETSKLLLWISSAVLHVFELAKFQML